MSTTTQEVTTENQQEQVVDVSKMSEDELHRLALEELTKEQNAEAQPEGETEQPRDENGRFTKKGDEPSVSVDAKQQPKADEEEQPSEYIFERAIDLGDGAGRQVFRGKGKTEADAYQNLVDQLAVAQTNATKKIRELSKAQKAERQLTEDEKFALSQKLLADPATAVKEILEIYGVETKQEREAVRQAEQQRDDNLANFLNTHLDYEDTPKNGRLLSKFTGGDHSPEALHKAYEELKADGLLDLKSDEAHVEQEEPKSGQKRIATKPDDEVPPQRTPVTRSSTLSQRGRTAPPVDEKTLAQKAASMTDEQLREAAIREFLGS